VEADDRLRTVEDQGLEAALQRLAAVVRGSQSHVGQSRAHGPVEEQDPALEGLTKGRDAFGAAAHGCRVHHELSAVSYQLSLLKNCE